MASAPNSATPTNRLSPSLPFFFPRLPLRPRVVTKLIWLSKLMVPKSVLWISSSDEMAKNCPKQPSGQFFLQTLQNCISGWPIAAGAILSLQCISFSFHFGVIHMPQWFVMNSYVQTNSRLSRFHPYCLGPYSSTLSLCSTPRNSLFPFQMEGNSSMPTWLAQVYARLAGMSYMAAAAVVKYSPPFHSPSSLYRSSASVQCLESLRPTTTPQNTANSGARRRNGRAYYVVGRPSLPATCSHINCELCRTYSQELHGLALAHFL